MNPLFSIITITYNAQSTLARTMRSVDEQSCMLYEHLIMDGASTDATLEIAEKFATERTKIFSSPDRGLYDAMNKGMVEARGEYLIFLNAGDTFHSVDTLQTIADAAMDDDFPGIIYGQTDIVDNDGVRLGPRHLSAPEVLTFQSFKDGMLVCHQAFVVLRRIAKPYNLHYRFSADYEWCLRCLWRSKRNHYIPEVLIDYLNEGVTTANHRKSLWERYRIMCRYYGTWPTIARHFKFLTRHLKR